MTRRINRLARDADVKYQQVSTMIKSKTPSTDEAASTLKQICYSYVSWVPGGRAYVDSAFSDLNAVREKHGEEVDKLVRETWGEFQSIAREGSFSFETAARAWDALAELGKKVANLSGDVAQDVVERHPQVKEWVGEPLRQMAEKAALYGPDAKKLVDETWQQVNEIAVSGVSMESADKVRKLVEEKMQQLKMIGDETWEKGMKQAQPYLDKAPRVRDMIMENVDALKEGNVAGLWEQVKSLGEGTDVSKVEEYVRKAVEKAKSSGGSLAQKGISAAVGSQPSLWHKVDPFEDVDENTKRKLREDLKALSTALEKHSDEATKLMQETKDDLRKVIQEKARKAQELAEKAKKGQ